MAAFPLLPCAQEEEDEEDEGLADIMKLTAKEKEERKSDHDVARQDVIKVNKRREKLIFQIPLVFFCFFLNIHKVLQQTPSDQPMCGILGSVKN